MQLTKKAPRCLFYLLKPYFLINRAGSGNVHAAINVSDFAGDAGCQVTAKEGGGIAYFFYGDIATQGGVFFIKAYHLVKVGNAGCGQCFDWAS